jgi:hypothetical protein
MGEEIQELTVGMGLITGSPGHDNEKWRGSV